MSCWRNSVIAVQVLEAIAWHWLLAAWFVSASRSLKIKQQKQSLRAVTTKPHLMPSPSMMGLVFLQIVSQTKSSFLKLFLVRCLVTTRKVTQILSCSPGSQWRGTRSHIPVPYRTCWFLSEKTFTSTGCPSWSINIIFEAWNPDSICSLGV